jgi:hypothetical protein
MTNRSGLNTESADERGLTPVDRVNPNRRRQFDRTGHEVDYFVRVVCADRGQHKRVVLTNARRELNGDRGMNFALECFAPPLGDQAQPNSLEGRESYVFRCPLCPRTPQVRASRWWALLDELVRADRDELDISLLP